MSGSTVGNIVRGATDVATFGTAEVGGISKRLGNTVGTAVSGKGIGGGLNAPSVGVASNPMNTLSLTGGAPLMMDIALGVSPEQALMTYFGASGDYNQWKGSLDQEDRQAVEGLYNQLGTIQSNVNMQNAAVQKLTQDYPNIMSQKIQQYSAIADPAMQRMMGQAMQQISAQQAAGGSISSGAAVEAAANVGAQYAGQELNYATGLANQDFSQQFSQAQALQNFQQKMLGQGAQQGFSAVQNMLQQTQGANLAQAGYQNQANQYNQNQSNAMYGALGGLAGTAVGGMFGGPAGAAVGGQAGSAFMGGDARLNVAPNAMQGSFGNNPFAQRSF